MNGLQMTEVAQSPRQRVLLLGASGTAGRATARAVIGAGHDLTCVLRPGTIPPDELAGATLRFALVEDAGSLHVDGFGVDKFDALISCLASRTGMSRDAWAIDHAAHSAALRLAEEAGVKHMVLMSAICVQKPRLAFQQAKLAFEAELQASGLTWSIVRPTALFKSLSGQIARVRAGKPFLIFGNGGLTATKPISDRDLGRYMARCLTDAALHNRILPIGGPGPAITPRDQGRALFRLTGRPERFRSVPPGLLKGVAGALSVAGRISQRAADRAEFARIGQYYATESMLIWDAARGAYNAEATPEFGTDRLYDHYAAVLGGTAAVDLKDHAVF
jgi:divinyl chlorophyllide a 8-vinyl-reductase